MGRKRVIALLLSAALICALCLVALPKTALAASGACLDFTATTPPTGSGFSWDSGSSTLTLTGLDYTSTEEVGIRLPAGSTIVLTAGTTNKIKSTAVGNLGCYGIQCDSGTITINGGGALIATGGNANDNTSTGIGIRGTLNVTGGSKVTGVGGTAPNASYGIAADRLIVDAASDVKGQGDSADFSFGISGTVINVSGSVKLTGIAGAGANLSVGISFSANSCTISNGATVIADATAGSGTQQAFGLSPTISNYPVYYWRAAKTGAYTASSGGANPYVWDATHTYVEIRPSLPGGGDATVGAGTGADVPKTGDSAQPWLWASLVALTGAGLAVNAVLRRKRRAESR